MKRTALVTLVGFLANASAMAQSLSTFSSMGNLSVVTANSPVGTSSTAIVGIAGLSTLVQSRAGDSLEITVSADVETTSDVYLFPRVDGSGLNPVVRFAVSGSGSHSFTFVKTNVAAGPHTVEIFWYRNSGATAAVMRARTLSVSSASSTWGEGRMAVVSRSGVRSVKDTASWEAIPSLSTSITTDTSRTVKATFSAEVPTGIGRFFARALVDGIPTADAMIDPGGSNDGGGRSYTFVKSGVPAGVHTVSMEWLANGGQIRLDDSTLAVTASASTTAGGGMSGRTVEGGPLSFMSGTFADVPNATQSFITNEPSTNLQLTFAAEMLTASRLKVRVLLDGTMISPGEVSFQTTASGFQAQSFSFVDKNILPGTHTLRVQAAVDASGFAQIGDFSLAALYKRRGGADFEQPFASFAPKSGVAPPIVVIGFDPQRPGVPRPSTLQLQNWLNGNDGGPSVRGWYAENTGGRFVPSQFMFVGWYDAPVGRRGSWYWDTNNFELMWKDAIAAADPDFNFRQYDANKDGVLSPNELGVMVLRPEVSPFGTNRPLTVAVDGTTLSLTVLDLYLSNRDDHRLWAVGTLAHEMAHFLLGAADLYSPLATAPGYYSIMDQHFAATHLDPIHKLKSGFLNPVVAEINKWTTRTMPLPAVEQKGDVIVIYSPDKKADQEYFIVENRFGGTWSNANYDSNLPGNGVVVWHMVQDAALASRFPPAGSGSCCPGDWARQGMRRLKVLSAFGDSIDLKWADGSTAGIRVTAKDNPQQDTPSVEIAKF